MRNVKIEDGTAWPDPTSWGETAWRLIHAPDSVTDHDKMNAARVMMAYSNLILHPAFDLKTVSKKVKWIRKAIKQQ